MSDFHVGDRVVRTRDHFRMYDTYPEMAPNDEDIIVSLNIGRAGSVTDIDLLEFGPGHSPINLKVIPHKVKNTYDLY